MRPHRTNIADPRTPRWWKVWVVVCAVFAAVGATLVGWLVIATIQWLNSNGGCA